MALIKCPECGKEVSETVDLCINCGYQIKPKKKVNKKQQNNLLTTPQKMNTRNAAKPHKHYVFAALPVPVAAV